MAQSTYSFSIIDDILFIEDEGGPESKTVTNDAENVLTEIAALDQSVIGLRVWYKDSEGQIDEIIPEWDGSKCVSVDFRDINIEEIYGE